MRNRTFLFGLLVVLSCGLIAAGCGGDDETTTVEDVTSDAAESIEGAQDQAQEALENAPENVDEVVEQCKEGVEDSGLSGDEKDAALEFCEQSGEAANDALDSAEDLQDQLGN